MFAVGDGTAQAAREAGYRNIASARGDVADLQQLILRTLPPGRIVHFCARDTAGDLAGFLRARGYSVERCIVYSSDPVPLRALVDIRKSLGAIDGITVYSPRAAARVARLIAGTRWAGRIWCISQACALEFAGMPGIQLFFARRPSEAAMIEMVRSHEERAPTRRAAGQNRTPGALRRPAGSGRLPANDNRPDADFSDRYGTTPERPDNEPPPAA